MNKTIISAAIAAFAFIFTPVLNADTASYLPVVEREGQKCYYYTAEKGESVYGITNKFGWDAEIFMKYNPKASDLKSGEVVYYPCEVSETDNNTVAAAVNTAVATVPPTTITDVSETVPAELLANLKEETYTVKKGDTLRSIARNNRMSLHKLFALNPGLTTTLPDEGTLLRTVPGSDMEQAEFRPVIEKVKTGVKSYKVKQKDTWLSIAHKNKIDTTALRAANPDLKILQKGTKILVPHLKDTLVNKWMPVEDPREAYPEGIADIYNDVHTGKLKKKGVADVAVLVSCNDASGRRRDLEFLKGFMLGIQGKTYTDIRMNLKGADLADYGSLAKALDTGEFDDMDMIICSVDKDFPQELIDFCRKRDIMLINVFDAKTDISEILPTGIQLLPSSSYFYDRTSDFLTRVMADRIFLYVGDSQADDESMSGAMLDRLNANGQSKVRRLANAAELGLYDFDPAKSYTIISDAGTKNDITATLNILEGIVDKYPNMPLSIIGRPNWMVYSASLEKLFRKLDTYIPSRFLFDDDSDKSKKFTADFRSYYNAAPLKSMPMYAAMGYDVADYIVDNFVKNSGDLNNVNPAEGQIQLDFRLAHPRMYDGFMNRRVYLLHFTPFSTTEKISL